MEKANFVTTNIKSFHWKLSAVFFLHLHLPIFINITKSVFDAIPSIIRGHIASLELLKNFTGTDLEI